MELTRLIFTKRFARLLATWFVITVAVLGVVASCTDSGGGGGRGMWQGGGDSEPGWR